MDEARPFVKTEAEPGGFYAFLIFFQGRGYSENSSWFPLSQAMKNVNNSVGRNAIYGSKHSKLKMFH